MLEDANLKLGVVLRDILGKSERAVLQTIVDGEDGPQRLAMHVSVRVKARRAEVHEALRGRVRAHNRFMLELHLRPIDALDKAIAEIEREWGGGWSPFARPPSC